MYEYTRVLLTLVSGLALACTDDLISLTQSAN
jgi:hypothetical protein